MVPVTSPEYRRGKAPPNKGQRYPVEVLSRAEIDRLLAACSSRAPSGVRNRALIVVLWRGGLRVAEACALYPRDIDPVAGTVNVRRGKGHRQRIVGLDAEAMAVVQRWLELRGRLGLHGRHPLFCVIRRGTRGRALHPARVRELLAHRAAKAGLDRRVHPHALRHTHASELSLEGVPVDVIRRQLGHRSLATTQRYLDHLSPAEVIRAMQARRWDVNGHDASPAS